MSNAITFRMQQGVQGDVSRAHPSIVEGQALGAVAFPQYGLAAIISSNKMVPVSGTGQTVYGFLVRPFPITGANASDPLGTGVPPTVGVGSILRRGYFVASVQLGASPALGTAVYARFQTPSGAQVLGGLENGTTANNYLLTPALAGGAVYFMGPVDANGLTEVSYNV